MLRLLRAHPLLVLLLRWRLRAHPLLVLLLRWRLRAHPLLRMVRWRLGLRRRSRAAVPASHTTPSWRLRLAVRWGLLVVLTLLQVRVQRPWRRVLRGLLL